MLKPSEICEACVAETAEMVPKYLDTEAVPVVQGGIPETTPLLAEKWDLIFFTGSPPVELVLAVAVRDYLALVADVTAEVAMVS